MKSLTEEHDDDFNFTTIFESDDHTGRMFSLLPHLTVYMKSQLDIIRCRDTHNRKKLVKAYHKLSELLAMIALNQLNTKEIEYDACRCTIGKGVVFSTATDAKVLILVIMRSGNVMLPAFQMIPNATITYVYAKRNVKNIIPPINYNTNDLCVIGGWDDKYCDIDIREQDLSIYDNVFILDPIIASGITQRAIINKISTWKGYSSRKILRFSIGINKQLVDSYKSNTYYYTSDYLDHEFYLEPGYGDVGNKLFDNLN